MLESLPHPSLSAAFLAGLLSFVSPCVLPLVPPCLVSTIGLSLGQLPECTEGRRIHKTIAVNALSFIAGFSLLFIAFGASTSLIGQVLTDYQQTIRKVGGVLLVLLGSSVTGRVALAFLTTEKPLRLLARPPGRVGSLLIGATCAAGWTPCVGPVLGRVFSYADTTELLTDGITLLTFYSLGVGLPFFLAAMGLARFLAFFTPKQTYLGMLSGLSGAFFIVFGVIIYTDCLSLLTALLVRYGIGVYIGYDGG